MGFRVKKEEGDFVVVPENVYPAELVSVEERNATHGLALLFTFKIIEGKFEGQTVGGWCSPEWKTGWKLDRWLQALGVSADVGEELDFPDDVIGRQCQIIVKVKEGDEKDFSQVKDLLQAKESSDSSSSSSEKKSKSTTKKKSSTKKSAPKAKASKDEDEDEETEGPFSEDDNDDDDDLDDIDW